MGNSQSILRKASFIRNRIATTPGGSWLETYQAAISTFARAMQWDSVSRKFVILAANWGVVPLMFILFYCLVSLDSLEMLNRGLPSRKLTYPTWGKGKSSSNMPYQGDMLIPLRVYSYTSCSIFHAESRDGTKNCPPSPVVLFDEENVSYLTTKNRRNTGETGWLFFSSNDVNKNEYIGRLQSRTFGKDRTQT